MVQNKVSVLENMKHLCLNSLYLEKVINKQFYKRSKNGAAGCEWFDAGTPKVTN